MNSALKDIVIIYHSDCADGFGAAYAAWKKFGDNASYLPWKEHSELPDSLTNKEIYIVDFSFHAPLLKQLNDTNKKVVVIDHHQSAEADVRAYPQNVFDNKHSGCVLAWQYFHPNLPVPKVLLYVEDHDLWKFALPENREFNAALHDIPRTFPAWDELIATLANDNELINFIAKGTLLARFEDGLVQKLLSYREKITWGDVWCYAVNASRLYRSVVGNELARLSRDEGGAPLGVVYYRYGGKVHISLRSLGDYDVAKLAEQYGGGGHKNASSIRAESFRNLPFEFLE